MYTHSKTEKRGVEDVCFNEKHIKEVLDVITNNFDVWFDKFLQSENGIIISDETFELLSKKFKVTGGHKATNKDKSISFTTIMSAAIEEFESDDTDYKRILDSESLEEYEDDLSTFKNRVLAAKCPIIRKTLQNKKATQLDKYRMDFSRSNPADLLRVVTNICEFKDTYETSIYNGSTIATIDNMGLAPLDTEEYTVYGVIGGGIKSLLLHKNNPAFFPNRSQFALWAMWFLTDKQDFGCDMDSEFLMIDVKHNITQQNYFYPYALFSYYAYEVYMMIKSKAEQLGTKVNDKYRYVIVDAFLNFIASENADSINLLTRDISERDYYYA